MMFFSSLLAFFFDIRNWVNLSFFSSLSYLCCSLPHCHDVFRFPLLGFIVISIVARCFAGPCLDQGQLSGCKLRSRSPKLSHQALFILAASHGTMPNSPISCLSCKMYLLMLQWICIKFCVHNRKWTKNFPFCQNKLINPITSNKQVIVTYGIQISPRLVLEPPLRSQIAKDPSLEPETTRSIDEWKVKL